MRIILAGCGLLLLSFGQFAVAEDAGDEVTSTCQATAWDMTQELKLFQGAPIKAPAGNTVQSAPIIAVGKLYTLDMVPQTKVRFAHLPGKDHSTESSNAGLAEFSVTAAGTYRITVDSPIWIDVVSPAGLINPSTFHGWHECQHFRKSIQYDLKPNQALVLQMSGAEATTVSVVVTAL